MNSQRFHSFNIQNQSTTKLLPKIKHKKREEEIEDLPSQISTDEWGEVQKYGKILDLEAKQKEKQDFLLKQRLVKQTLD